MAGAIVSAHLKVRPFKAGQMQMCFAAIGTTSSSLGSGVVSHLCHQFAGEGAKLFEGALSTWGPHVTEGDPHKVAEGLARRKNGPGDDPNSRLQRVDVQLPRIDTGRKLDPENISTLRAADARFSWKPFGDPVRIDRGLIT